MWVVGQITDAAEPVAADFHVLVEDVADPRTDGQVGGTDDAGRHARVAVGAGGAHRGDTIHELVSPTAFISSGPSVRHIAEHSMKTVATILCPEPVSSSRSSKRPVFTVKSLEMPKMMMRIDDREVRL